MTDLSFSKGEATRKHVFDTALKLFRRRGFERTTMRDIAAASGLSLGAAYHYFPSKDSLVLAYYEWIQREHERLAAASTAPEEKFETRLRRLLLSKLDLLRRDRKVLAVLFANLGSASHPHSVFAKETAPIRDRSIAQFADVLSELTIPEELREPSAYALWLSHLAVFLFFIHDSSPDQRRTRALVNALVDLVAFGAPLLGHPLALPIRTRIRALLGEIAPAEGG